MNAIIHSAEEPLFAVVGTLLQFVSTPEQNRANMSVMRGVYRQEPSFRSTAMRTRRSFT
jgi:hypothetical protein